MRVVGKDAVKMFLQGQKKKGSFYRYGVCEGAARLIAGGSEDYHCGSSAQR